MRLRYVCASMLVIYVVKIKFLFYACLTTTGVMGTGMGAVGHFVPTRDGTKWWSISNEMFGNICRPGADAVADHTEKWKPAFLLSMTG